MFSNLQHTPPPIILHARQRSGIRDNLFNFEFPGEIHLAREQRSEILIPSVYYNLAYEICTHLCSHETIVYAMFDVSVAKRFSRVLKARRKEAGLTQDQLSELSGVSVEHIRRLEGKSPCGVRLEAIVKLSKAVKCTPAEFINEL